MLSVSEIRVTGHTLVRSTKITWSRVYIFTIFMPLHMVMWSNGKAWL